MNVSSKYLLLNSKAFWNPLICLYALLVIDQGSGSTPKGPDMFIL